ncbi:Disease resistance response protein [Sesamum alatum]|uniref:Dirigent protein n=1 Tax=Sesamum alatum TaxID=300844 RepID=A0AAE2CHR1_9LAMI|nr:Disease resistance response protein [Sesamum alatum]
MATKSLKLPMIICSFLLLVGCSAARKPKALRHRRPCKRLVFYFHDILYNGHNAKNSTSAIVGAPAWGNTIHLTPQNHFGNIVVFDDPITLDNNLHSPRVGRAQGFYLYDKKEVFTSWIGMSFVFNSTRHKGTINFAGADPILSKTRDISVIGGTGDFRMSRGIATLATDAYEGEVYFRLRCDIKLYECCEFAIPLISAPKGVKRKWSCRDGPMDLQVGYPLGLHLGHSSDSKGSSTIACTSMSSAKESEEESWIGRIFYNWAQ